MQRPAFYFGVGIENTWMTEFLPDIRPDKRLLDEYLWMGHYDHLEADLQLAKALGVNAIRYSVPWYRSEPAPGSYDWSWIEKPLAWLEKNQIIPIIDLLHYGPPLWMEQGFLNSAFPDALAGYAAQFARRFGGLVDHYTPVNEPQTTLMLSGWLGEWPPYLKGLEGWLKLACPLGRAQVLASQALRAELTDVTLVSADCHNNPSWHSFTSSACISPDDDQAELLFEYFPSSLAYGRIPPGSALWDGLARLGLAETEMASIYQNAQLPDIFGCNFYPVGGIEPTSDLKTNQKRLVERCERVYRAFGCPVYITETSAGPGVAEKIAWIELLDRTQTELTARGIPLAGINWWLLYSTVAWDYRDSNITFRESLEHPDWIFNQGLYDIEIQADGVLKRVPTPTIEPYIGLQARILTRLAEKRER